MAESLTFNVGADTSGFQTGIGGMLTGLAGLAAAFVSVQAVVEGFSNAIEMGGRLHDLSTRTGETAGNLAILERAFENASVGAEKLGPAIAKMQKSMVDMQQGSEEAVAAFAQLGLTWADLEEKSPSEQLQLIGIRLSSIEDPALRAETAMRIFGKSGAELIPVLTNFSAETELAKQQLGSLPQQLDESAEAVDSFGDNLSAIRNKMTEMAYGFLSEVVPALDLFTSKLAGIDAAGLGAQLATALAGAFIQPTGYAEVLGDTLILGVKKMGNELIYQVQYWADVLFNTFATLGDDIIPLIGNILTGEFAVAVGTLGTALADVFRPLADMLGLDFIEELAAGSKQLMEDGFSKITESANQFQSALEGAKLSSTVVREDFTGAEAAAENIASNFAGLQDSTKAAMDELMTPVGQLAPQSGADITQADIDQIRLRYEADMKVQQEAQNKQNATTTKTTTQTAAQAQAALNKQLGIIAGANTNQAIGQSASAQKVIDLTKELTALQALGQGDSAEAMALQASIDRNTDIALGNVLTPAEEETARQWALTEWMNDTSQSFDDLQQAQEDAMLAEKRGFTADAGEELKKQAGLAKDQQQGKTVQSVAQAVLSILQKIEPKLPQHIMS